MKFEVPFALENAGWPALLVDDASTILRANQAAAKILGPAVEGETSLLSAVWAAENGTTADGFLAQWSRAPSPTVSLRFRVKGGGATAFTTSICALTRGEQKLFILQLIPESTINGGTRGQTNDMGLVHKQKLDRALQLARSVALEFNNALTSVLGYTSLLLNKAEANHPWRRSLLEVEKSAAKAAAVAADLASFSLQEKEPRGQVAGNLNIILQRCVEFFHNSLKEPVAWDVQLERRLFATKFDEAKIQQVFMKLLENAVEALKENGRISVRTHNIELTEPTQDRNATLAAGEYVCVEISDTGLGIGPEVLPRIFEPFFTTKKGAHRGLGLAWVYGIVTNHGGGAAVSSEPGAGTSVRVYLPAEKTVVRDRSQAGDDLTGTQTILMVDDEDLLLTMGQTILSSYGYHVLTANSGQSALEILSRNDKPIDLVITDLVMPIMSGRELVEQLRRLSPDIPIMCTSGYVWPGSKPEETTYLQKPFTTQELLMKVKYALSSN